MSGILSVFVEGIEITNVDDVIRWRQHLHVSVKIVELGLDPHCIFISCEDKGENACEVDLEYRNPPPMIQGDCLQFSVRPKQLGDACLRLGIIREPDARNEYLDYRFRLISPFALPNNESVSEYCAQVIRSDLKERILGSITQPRERLSHSAAARAYCGGLWIYGPLCSGKTTLVQNIRNYLEEFPLFVVRNTKLHREMDPDSDIVCDLQQGSFLAYDTLRAGDELLESVQTVDKWQVWVPKSDVVKIQTKKINFDGLRRDYRGTPLNFGLYSEIMKALGAQPTQIRGNGHDQIWDELVRRNQHLLIVLDEFDRIQVLDNRMALDSLLYLTDLVDLVLRKTGVFGVTVMVVDHSPPEARGLSRPLQNFWRKHEIGFFSEPDISSMMTEVFDNPNDILSPRVLYQRTKGHPLFVNLILHVLLKHLGASELEPPVDFRKVKNLLLRDSDVKETIKWWVSKAKLDLAGGEDQINRRLVPDEKKVLRALINGSLLGLRYETEIRALRYKGFIHPENDEFRFQLIQDVLTNWSSLLNDE